MTKLEKEIDRLLAINGKAVFEIERNIDKFHVRVVWVKSPTERILLSKEGIGKSLKEAISNLDQSKD